MRYIALIDGAAGAYGISFPDLPGCTAMGRTVDEALSHASEALRDYAEVTEEDGGALPDARPADAVCRDADVREMLAEGAQLASVPLVRAIGRAVKANLSIDAGVLKALDEEAKRRGLTRSGMVELMTREMLPRVA